MKEQLVSVFTSIRATDVPPSYTTLEKILDKIKYSEQIVPMIVDIRAEKDKKERNELKSKLPIIVFSGICNRGIKSTKTHDISYRHDASVTEHTGIAIIDFDGKTVEEITKIKKYLKRDNCVISFFDSPSGEGNLKALYHFPKDTSMHRSHYRALLEDLSEFDPDPTSINISRACYMSHDPNLYVNWTSQPYEKFITEPEIDKELIRVDPNIPDNVLTDYSKFSLAAKMIDTAKDGFKHITLLKASYLMGGFIAAGIVEERDAHKMLRDRISARELGDLRLAFKTIDDGIREGKYKPIYEIEDLEKSFKIHLSKEEYFDEARGYSFLVDMTEEDEKMFSYIKDGLRMGLTTNIKHLDEHFLFKENNFNVVLGHDNIGKSTVIWFLAVLSAALHGWKWLLYSPENQIFRIKKQLIDFVLGEDSRKVSRGRMMQAKQFVDSMFFFIRKDEVYSLYNVLDYGRLMVDENPDIKGFMIDPYNSLSLDYKEKGAGLNSYEYHVRAISEIRVFSEAFCSTYVNNHSVTSARRNAFDADGNLKRPQKDDVDQGAIWANRCDDFITCHRKIRDKDEFMWTEFHVDKVKDTETGGSVTSAKEPVRLKLWYGCDFISEKSGKSPLKQWRTDFFSDGEQLPLIETKDAW